MEPLAGLDAAFLALETGNNRLHVAAVLVLDPPEGKRALYSPATRFAQIRRLVGERVGLVPQLRQRAVRVPFGLHHPVWADDPEFDLDDHVRRARLPDPGGRRELEDLVADLVSRPLDPDRPLWELVVVEGLAGGRSALVAKVHHAVADGVGGASLLAAFLDLGPRGRPVPLRPEPWVPVPPPSGGTLLRHAATALARQPEVAAATAQRGVDALVEVARHNQQLVAEGGSPPPAPFRAPRTSLQGRLSSRRRYATVSVPLDDVKSVGRTYGTTVNDVLLAAVGGAVRRLFAERGEVADGSLVALVPVSTRPPEKEAGAGGGGGGGGGGATVGGPANRVSAILVPLATDVEDPVERLLAVSRGASVAKHQERLAGGALLAGVAQLAPPALLSGAVRLASGLGLVARFPPLGNLTVSGVRGPDVALWCAGSRVSSLYPVGPVAEGLALNVTAMSYQGTVHFGLLGCRRLVPDVHRLGVLLDDALAELSASALDARGAAG